MNYPFLITSNGITFEDYISKHKEFLLRQLDNLGAVLLRGFNLKNELDFEEAIKKINPTFMNYFGGDSPREKVTAKVYTSTSYPADQTISMHHEKSYSNHYPKYVYFFCQIAPEVGGETPIADGRAIYKKMPNHIIDKFENKNIKYIMNLHSGIGIGKSWQEAFEVNEKEELTQILSKHNIDFKWKKNNQLQVEEVVNPIITLKTSGEKVFFSQVDQWHPSNLGIETFNALKEIMSEDDFYHNCKFADGSEIDINDISIIRMIVNSERVFFKWEKGDLLLLNNLISMHGRMPFQGARRILVSMS